MKELLKLFTDFYGEPASLALIKKDDVEFYVAISELDEPAEEGDYCTVMTLGLSLTPELEEQDIELELNIEGAMPENAAEHFGDFFYAIFQQIKSYAEIEQGMLLKDIPKTPYFKDSTAVILTDDGNYLDEMSDELRGRLITVIPLYEQEVSEFEELIPYSRHMYVQRSLATKRDPKREETIMAAAVNFYCREIAAWAKKNKAQEAKSWAKSLKSGGDPEAGQRLEQKLGFAIPSDFKYFFNLLPKDVYLSINRKEMRHEDSIVESLAGMNKLNNTGQFEYAVKNKLDEDTRRQFAWWHERWVPIAMDSAGTYVVIDMAPGEYGVPGQLMLHDNIQGPLYLDIPNFLLWLDDYHSDLKANRYKVVEGHVLHEEEYDA